MKTYLIIAAASLAACSPALAESRTYNLAGFDAVKASAGVNVILKQGAFAVRADGTDRALDRLDVSVQGGVLRITHKSDMNMFGFGRSAVVTVTAPAYASIAASSGSDVSGADLRFDALKASSSSGADLELSGSCRSLSLSAGSGADFVARGLTCTSITAEVSGGGDADLSGACETLEASASGGADFGGAGLKCRDAVVRASGGGEAEVHATGTVKAYASGGGDVRILGGGNIVEQDESGGGDIRVS
jgi:hypothetical protein